VAGEHEPPPGERREYRSQGRRARRGLAVAVAAGAVVVAGAWAATRGGGPVRTVEEAEVIPPVATPAEPLQTVRLSVVGDTIMGTIDYGLPPNGGANYFDAVEPLLEGDIVLGNLEGTLTTRDGSKCAGSTPGRCFAFRTPPTYVRHLKAAGFTVMNLANNHANDFGPAGEADTVAALTGAGIAETGRPGRFTVKKIRGVRVAVVGFATYSWSNRLDNLTAARRLVERADRTADIVVVTMHAGAEGTDAAHVTPGTETYLGENRGDVMAFASTVVAAGADLVVGHGPHVLRGMQFTNGRLVAYSMGNFAGYKALGLGGALSETGVLQVTLRADGTFVSGRLRAVQLVNGGIPAPGGRAIEIVSQLSRADFSARAARLDTKGTIRPPEPH
jgi:Bacterial capsule synthesis protein PGA_cap